MLRFTLSHPILSYLDALKAHHRSLRISASPTIPLYSIPTALTLRLFRLLFQLLPVSITFHYVLGYLILSR